MREKNHLNQNKYIKIIFIIPNLKKIKVYFFKLRGGNDKHYFATCYVILEEIKLITYINKCSKVDFWYNILSTFELIIVVYTFYIIDNKIMYLINQAIDKDIIRERNANMNAGEID